MANIFGGVPLLRNGYEKPDEGPSPYYSSFMQGVQRKDRMREQEADRQMRGEELELRRQAAARDAIMQNVQIQEAAVRMAEAAAKYNAFSLDNEMKMEGYKLLPKAQLAFSAVMRHGDWSNPVEWLNFLDANPNARFTPLAQEATKLMQAAIDDKARLDQIREMNAGKMAVAEERGSVGSRPIASEIKFQRLQAARDSGDPVSIAYWERVTQGRDIPIVEKIERYKSVRDDPNADPDELLALETDLDLGISRSDRTKLEEQVSQYDSSIEAFESLASGNKLSNDTVGPISRAFGGLDFFTGLMGQDIYNLLGGKAREGVRTQIKSLVARNTRSLIDEPGGVLSNSDKQQARDIISADNFLSTPQRARTELRTLAEIMKRGKERAQKRLAPRARTQSGSASLRTEAENAIARGASREAVARRFKEQTGEDF